MMHGSGHQYECVMPVPQRHPAIEEPEEEEDEEPLSATETQGAEVSDKVEPLLNADDDSGILQQGQQMQEGPSVTTTAIDSTATVSTEAVLEAHGYTEGATATSLDLGVSAPIEDAHDGREIDESMLEKLFASDACIYRSEGYWGYEVSTPSPSAV